MAERKKCRTCLEDRAFSNYYKSYSSWDGDGHLPVCKSCLRSHIKGREDDYRSVREIMRIVDKPFLQDLWNLAMADKKETLGTYFKNVNLNNKEDNYDDSDKRESVIEKSTQLNTDNDIEVNKDADVHISSEELKQLPLLKEKYGHGYPDDQYFLFESKYALLKPSFQLLTTMHEEYFKEYCINKVKETLAKARGDFKEAKEWAAMVKDVAEAGKLKPSQMSKADLSAGLDGFGQLARTVEEKMEIMPILPKFISQPKDKPDVVLWAYINYARDLKGLPEAEYKDIYEFYEERRKDYERQELDSDPSMNGDTDG